MTEREVLKLALEALEDRSSLMKWQMARDAVKEALREHAMYEVQRLGQEIQPEQEPVAVKHMMEWVDYLKRKSDHGQHMKIPAEMSAGACWELAIELEQFINTTPPQRTWVGLTDEEIVQCQQGDIYHFYRSIEAKLKEKNT